MVLTEHTVARDPSKELCTALGAGDEKVRRKRARRRGRPPARAAADDAPPPPPPTDETRDVRPPQAWQKPVFTTDTERFPKKCPGHSPGSFLNLTQEPDESFHFYDAKPDLEQNVAHTKAVYGIVHGGNRKDVASRAKVGRKQDPRYHTVKDAYKRALGPGTYSPDTDKVTASPRPTPGIRLPPSAPSPCFSSVGRVDLPPPDLPRLSDCLKRDSKTWTSKGSFMPRSSRWNGVPTWPKERWEGTFRESKGLRGMSAKGEMKAFHSVYSDLSTSSFFGGTGTLEELRAKTASPTFRSNSPRFVILPNHRSNDFRLRGEEGARGVPGPQIGPGSYHLDMMSWANLQLDQNLSSSARATAREMFARPYSGTVKGFGLAPRRPMASTMGHDARSAAFSMMQRFEPSRNGNTSPRKDSSLMRTW